VGDGLRERKGNKGDKSIDREFFEEEIENVYSMKRI
jgi:hypothetical protein